jgi:hypothetical protein
MPVNPYHFLKKHHNRCTLITSGEIPDAGVEDAAEPDEEADDAGRVHGGGARLQLRQPIRDKLS